MDEDEGEDEENDLAVARRAVQRAAETANDREARLVLKSVDEGLMEIGDGEKTRDSHAHADRVKELEKKLGGLEEDVEGQTYNHLLTARERFERYRERHAE